MNTSYLLPFVLGFIIDLIIGDPHKMPHLIKLYGNVIYFLTKKLNQGRKRKLKGALMSVFLITSSYTSFYILKETINHNPYLNITISSILVFYGLSNKNLIEEVKKVNNVLLKKGLEAGRKQLSYIVGRDTETLSEQEVRKASLETLSENLSDGVIAPLFYLFIGGFPLMLTYKMVNTLDSMIGYKNDKYIDFGCIAAKTDDVFNYLPSRITALLIALVSFKYQSLQFIFKYGNKHSSPNAGYLEAAMAGALDCRFGGPSVYFGKTVEKPYIGENNLHFTDGSVNYACKINLMASILFLALGCTILYFLNQ